jgi:adenylate cyclase
MLGMAVLSTAVAAGSWKLELLWLPNLERILYDSALTRFTQRSGQSSDIVVLAIDQPSLDQVRANTTYALNFGNYPWSRNLWAHVVDELAHRGARAVLFDMVMDDRSIDPSTDLAFAQAVRDTGMPFYLGVSTHPSMAPLPKVEPVHTPREFTPPRPLPRTQNTPPDAAGEPGEFQEQEDPNQAPADPEQAARALAFPVRTEGRTLTLLEHEIAPGLRKQSFLVPPLPLLLPEAGGFGLVDVEPDPDGSMRRTRFAYTDGQNAYVTLPVALAADLFGAKELEFSGRTMRLGSRTFALNADGSAEIDFGGTLYERFRLISVVQVLDSWSLRQARQVPPGDLDMLRGKIVVVGGLALGLGDHKATPFTASTPGVSKQVAVLQNLLEGRFITEAPFWVSVLFGLGLALLSVVVLMTLRSPLLEFAWLLGIVPAVFLVVGTCLSVGRVHPLAAVPAASALLASLGAMASNHLFANREAMFIRQAFSRYMEPRLIEQMIEERQLPQLDGEERELTAFFSDIRGFSTFSESFRDNPRALVSVLNQYLTRVSSALLQQGGCLDKYIGDAVVCLFGAPINHTDHAVRACRGALAVQAAVEELRAEFRQKGLPDVYTRIGLNTAKLFVGNFGSEQLFDYTAMGDGMNLAARLEGANKAYGSLIMIGPRTYELARDHIEVRELDQIRVAGKAQAVKVYELLALQGELPAGKSETVARYHEALAMYRLRHFEEAARVLEAQLAKDPFDGPTAALLERCREYVESPPPSTWDGVTSLDK